MASPITKVVLAGSTGNLGPAILSALIDAGFQVTVLTRQTSTNDFPSTVTVTPVDYDSLDSLTQALQGHDAVISTLASEALTKQLLLVEAAAKAGVKRFLPSEFGSNTSHPKSSQFPAYAHKIEVQEALKRQEASGMSWTVVNNGAFLDWGVMVGFLINLKGKQVTLYDGGDNPFSTTTLVTVGKAVVGVLKHPAETKNRVVYVQEAAITPRKLAEIAKKVVGADGWKEDVVSIEDVLTSAWAELKRPGSTPDDWVMKFITAAVWGKDYGCLLPKNDNELLGIKEMTDDELQAVLAQYA